MRGLGYSVVSVSCTQNANMIKKISKTCVWIYVHGGDLRHSKMLFSLGHINFKILFLKTLMASEFLITAFILFYSQPAITCSKLTIKTPEQGVKYVQS